MLQQMQNDWQILAVVAVVVLLVAWLLLRRGSGRARERHHAPDVLDEGAERARRNQALIDAPAAAAPVTPPVIPMPGAELLGGVAEIVASAASEEVAEAEPRPEVATTPPPAAPQPAAESADDLTRIKGLGPKLKALLGTLGVTTFAQIAAWDDAELARIDSQLGAFAGRPQRDNWIEQARMLTAGDTAGFEDRFGKI